MLLPARLRPLLFLLLTSPVLAGAGWPDLRTPAKAIGGGDKDVSVVVGVEAYAHLVGVPGAGSSAGMWHDYLNESIGVPQRTAALVRDVDASAAGLRAEIDRAVGKVEEGGTLWLVFVGQGSTSDDGELLIQLFGTKPEQRGSAKANISITELRQKIAKSKAKRVVLIVDACLPDEGSKAPLVSWSLQTKGKQILTVMAGRCGAYGGQLPGAARPAVSYLALGAMRGWADKDGDGKVSAAELGGYVSDVLHSVLRASDKPASREVDRDFTVARSAGEQGPDVEALVRDMAALLSAPRTMVGALAMDLRRDGLSPDPNVVRGMYMDACSRRYIPACQWKRWHQGEEASVAVAARVFAPLCEAGDALACVVVGWSKAHGPGGLPSAGAKDPKGGAALFEKACKARYPRGCAELASLHAAGVGVKKDKRKAQKLYKSACDSGDGLGCRVLAFQKLPEGSRAKPKKAAVALLQKACKAADPHACSRLGALTSAGRGVPQDALAAAELYQQACAGGAASGCYELGLRYADGQGVRKDEQRAASLFEQGCNADAALGCRDLGQMYVHGTGVKKDEKKAAALFERGCKGKDAVACAALAGLYTEGEEVEPDERRAARLYEQACEGGHAGGCTGLGLMLREGRGVRTDLGRAAKLFEKACMGEDLQGCRELGLAYKKGEGVPADGGRAEETWEFACTSEDGPSCHHLAALLARGGGGVKRDPARARKLFRRACKLGHVRACMARP